jgi:dTMP kinase
MAAQQASGRNVTRIGFPRRDSSTGRMLNNYLQTKDKGADLDAKTLHLLFAANRWESANEIYKRLLSGQDIVLDRYAFSGIAYSVAKGLDAGWCQEWEKFLPAPDVVFFLDIEPSVAAQRPGYGQERYERIEFQSRVREAFHELLQGASREAASRGLPATWQERCPLCAVVCLPMNARLAPEMMTARTVHGLHQCSSL